MDPQILPDIGIALLATITMGLDIRITPPTLLLIGVPAVTALPPVAAAVHRILQVVAQEAAADHLAEAMVAEDQVVAVAGEDKIKNIISYRHRLPFLGN